MQMAATALVRNGQVGTAETCFSCFSSLSAVGPCWYRQVGVGKSVYDDRFVRAF